MAHEIGHVLGFHHPDKEWELNLNADGVMANATCQNSLNYVHLNQTQRLADSIMFSMTKHRDRTCLGADDLEGLNYLYPTCDGAMKPSTRTGEPACIKSKRFSGWLRLIYAVLIPWTFVSSLAILTQCLVRRHTKLALKQYKSMWAKSSKNLLKLEEASLNKLARNKKPVSHKGAARVGRVAARRVPDGEATRLANGVHKERKNTSRALSAMDSFGYCVAEVPRVCSTSDRAVDRMSSAKNAALSSQRATSAKRDAVQSQPHPRASARAESASRRSSSASDVGQAYARDRLSHALTETELGEYSEV